MMENTFAYTARSSLEPERVVTFTLHDHHMSVQLGALMEHVERALRSEETSTDAESQEEQAELEAPEEPRRHPVMAVVKPTAVSLLEMGTRPFHVRDVAADSDGRSSTSGRGCGRRACVQHRFSSNGSQSTILKVHATLSRNWSIASVRPPIQDASLVRWTTGSAGC